MTPLEEIKLKEEIKALKTSRLIDFIKGIAMLVGSVILFIAIQMPESVLNKKMSNESISRDRAKLIFDLIHNNKDDQDILMELSVLEKAYPENNSVWIAQIKDFYKTRINSSNNLKALEDSIKATHTTIDINTITIKTKTTEAVNTATKTAKAPPAPIKSNNEKETPVTSTSPEPEAVSVGTKPVATTATPEKNGSEQPTATTSVLPQKESTKPITKVVRTIKTVKPIISAATALRLELKELYAKKEKLQIESFTENPQQTGSTSLQRKIADINALIKKKEIQLENLK